MVDIRFHCDEEKNFIEGISARAFTYTDYSIAMHNHDFYEINIVLAGTGTHCIENAQFFVKPGDVFVIPPMVAHAYTDTEKLEVYHILLKKRFLEEHKQESERVNGFLQFMEIEPFLRSNSAQSCFLRLGGTQLLRLQTELAYIDDEGDFPWEECALMKYHALWKLLYWFSYALFRQNNSPGQWHKNKYERQIISALEYIHNHYADKITIDILCAEAFLSRATFLRNFKAVCGVTPVEYLNGYRCKKAAEQLAKTGCSKTEVAHNCGFYDLSHMERMIKKYS